MNADKILPILCRYLKDTDNRLLATSSPKLYNLGAWNKRRHYSLSTTGALYSEIFTGAALTIVSSCYLQQYGILPGTEGLTQQKPLD